MTPPVATAPTLSTSLAAALATALHGGSAAIDSLYGAAAADRRDRFLTLLAIYDLHTAPLQSLGETAHHQGHPVVADLKHRLEADWLAELTAVPLPAGLPADPVAGMRALAARDRLPAAYKWLAREADWAQLVHFLALEGGPDGGFDDLIALCQVGLSGSAKVELAQNYWDEMGNGDLDRVHTVLHDTLVAAIDMPRIPRTEQPVESLERVALGYLFATNRWLQPEMVGALGLLELQAGPRCRLVLQAFDRLGAPPAAYPFYVEHAEVDPRHGKDWLEKAVGPLGEELPSWRARILRGAWWRERTNAALFERIRQELIGQRSAA
ncbi:MAG: iron-containing redox enzyme family protein [Actinomycetota bacterium]|nr:iron-containing redox enzyme family protein [Actinomycetota bacterium]